MAIDKIKDKYDTINIYSQLRVNNVSEESPVNFVSSKDNVETNEDVEQYVRILKGKAIPPEDSEKANILLTLDLGVNITVEELKKMIEDIEAETKQ
jgi:hypothetical protein